MTLRVCIGKYDMFGLAGMGVGDWFSPASAPDLSQALRKGSSLVVASSRGLQTR